MDRRKVGVGMRKKTQHSEALRRTYAKQSKELTEQFAIINGAMCILFQERYGYRNKKIHRIALSNSNVWKEVSEAVGGETVLELCERETGIEMSLDGEKSYHEFPYLDHNKWKGMKYPSEAQEIFILNQEIKWIPSMMLAVLCISMHRLYGWGFGRLAKLCTEIDTIRKEGHSSNYYRKLCKERYDLILTY